MGERQGGSARGGVAPSAGGRGGRHVDSQKSMFPYRFLTLEGGGGGAPILIFFGRQGKKNKGPGGGFFVLLTLGGGVFFQQNPAAFGGRILSHFRRVPPSESAASRPILEKRPPLISRDPDLEGGSIFKECH